LAKVTAKTSRAGFGNKKQKETKQASTADDQVRRGRQKGLQTARADLTRWLVFGA